jgi:hypothetical protein
MNASSFAIGTEPATQIPPTSQSLDSPQSSPQTVQELLMAIDPGPQRKHPMLWTTSQHLSVCADVPLNQMGIDTLRVIGPAFDLYLKGRRFTPKSVSTYAYYLRKLLDIADELGVTPRTRELIEAWKPITDAVRTDGIAPRSVTGFAVSRGTSPTAFTDDDLAAWADWMQLRGRKHRSIRILKGRFRRAVKRAGLEHMMPGFNCTHAPTYYKVRTSAMPEPLKSEVRALLEWKMAKFARGRPQWTRHRASSAKELENWIGRVYGYAVNMAGHSINTLSALFTEDVISSFVEWAINRRGLTRATLLRLSLLYGALRHHPRYRHNDYGWFTTLFDQLPEDDKSVASDRKARKYASYDAISTVPGKIRESRIKKKLSALDASWSVHDELIILWLITLAWRQRNIRECRIGNSENANLFFAPLPALKHVAKPKWVEEVLRENPDASFWQFFFREDETKTGKQVRGILPRTLIPLLEEYLKEHRPSLVADGTVETLFLNRWGTSLDANATRDSVSELMLEHTGRRVNPHLVRDILAYRWLEDHPEDFLTLSKILWHGSVKYTLLVYGRNFDESNGTRRVDEWLEERSSR